MKLKFVNNNNNNNTHSLIFPYPTQDLLIMNKLFSVFWHKNFFHENPFLWIEQKNVNLFKSIHKTVNLRAIYQWWASAGVQASS